jgi:hypothetical protein
LAEKDNLRQSVIVHPNNLPSHLNLSFIIALESVIKLSELDSVINFRVQRGSADEIAMLP